MATMDFPASPSTGDIHTHSGKRWQWDGAVWRAYSLAFTGTPVAPTATADTNTTQIATTAYVQTELGDYAPLADPTFTGTPDAPTAAADTNTTQLATTAFVMTEVGDYLTTATASSTYAPKANPEFTGNVTMQSLDMDDIVAGDVIYGSGADTLARLAKGSDAEVLTLASGVPTWAAAGGGGGDTDEIIDADSDTKIQVEESADEDKIRFDTGGTERVVIDSSGLEIKSGGLKLDNLSNAGANVLDDYEEGTFSVTVTTGSGSITIASNTLHYTKVGRVCHIQGLAGISSVSSPASWVRLDGLPFTSHASVNHNASVATLQDTASVLTGDIGAVIFANSSSIQYYRYNFGPGITDLNPSGYIDAGSYFMIQGSYITNT